MCYIRKRKKSVKKRLIIAFICVFAAAALLVTYINRKLDAIVSDVAEEQIRSEIASTLSKIVKGYDLDKEYIKISYENGGVKSITTNTGALNALKAAALYDVTEAIKNTEEYRIDVSFANIFDDEVIFGNSSFTVSAGILPVYGVDAEIKTKFEDAGINQTHYSVILSINVDVNAIMLISTVNVRSNYELCVAEAIIVGDVPEIYLYGE